MATNSGNLAVVAPSSATPRSPSRRATSAISATPVTSPSSLAPPPGKHWLGRARGVVAHHFICRHGARSPAQCGQQAAPRIAVLLEGLFQARTPLGSSLLVPGTLLLTNAGDPYEFRHVDDGGDRSLVLELDESMLADAQPSLGGFGRGAQLFSALTAPAQESSLQVVAHARAALRARSPELLRETAILALERAILARRPAAGALPPLVSARRVARAIRYVEAHSGEDCSLDALAAEARVSPFHLVRLFRAATGKTPHQFVLATRLGVAEQLLRTSNRPVTEVSLDAGFGDLSHFGAAFRRAFGCAPRAYRKRCAGPRYSGMPSSEELGT